ncbi:MAG TPA: ATP-binding protein [Thermoleophilaceae bacterium]|nr:ATP-binding protein [Thermoleophilaceae bacterium]
MRQAWLPAAPEGAPQARALVREAASELELDANTTYELMLATTEAFANAVEHGTPCKTGGVFVCVRSHGRGVGIEVCDCGGCFPSPPDSRKPRAEGGRGIAIIAAIMDRLEVLPDGDVTRVCFEKWLAPA